METHAPLSDEEIQRLRQYLAPGRTESRQYWLGWAILALLPILFLVLSQVEMRWLPKHLEADGLAVCRMHPTLRHGVIWWPAEKGFDAFCRVTGAVLTLCAFYASVGMYAAFHHERRARQFALMVARAYPQITFAPFVRSRRAG